MKTVATVLGSIVAALGAIGALWPDALLLLGRELDTPAGIFATAVLRVLFGASLLYSAHESNLPRTLRAVGALALITGVATPFFGSVRPGPLVGAVSELDDLWLRFAAGCASALGVGIVWALSPKAGPTRR
jgi:hypothetical protein